MALSGNSSALFFTFTLPPNTASLSMSVAKLSASQPVVLGFHATRNALYVPDGVLGAHNSAAHGMLPALSAAAVDPSSASPGWAVWGHHAVASASLDRRFSQVHESSNYQVRRPAR